MKVTPWNGKPISEPGVFSGVDSSTYHGPDLCVGPSISSSGLRKIFTASAMDYWVTSPYNPKRLEGEPSRAFVHGRCAHHLILGEAEFAKNFIVRPAEYADAKTGELKKWTAAAGPCKAWLAEQAAAGLEVVTPEELEQIKGMAGILPWQEGLQDSGLLNNAMVKAGILHGLVEHTIVCLDKETGVWLKARPDVIPTDSTEAADFKGTQTVARRKLQRTLDDFRYDMQASIVARCLEEATGVRLTNFALVFACKTVPHEVAVRELKPVDMDESASDVTAALRTFALGMETGRWPGIGGGEEDARYIERSDYSRADAAERRAQLSAAVFGAKT